MGTTIVPFAEGQPPPPQGVHELALGCVGRGCQVDH